VSARVLHFFKTYYPDTFGGIERVIWSIASGCTPLGFESTVLSLSDQPEKNSVRLATHMAEKAKLDFHLWSTGLSFSALKRFRDLSAEADILHFHHPWPMADLAWLTGGRRKPSVVTYHADILRNPVVRTLYAPLMHSFLARATRIVATSDVYVRSSPVLARHRRNLSVIPLGIADRAGEVGVEKVETWRARLPERFFLFTGALRYYKGLHVLFEAARLSGENVVVIGGGPADMHWRSEASRVAGNRVVFLGQVHDTDKFAILKLCRALAFPSHLRAEAFGLSLVEAAMMGRPMISCEIGTGTSYVNVGRQTGLVVAPDDAAAFADAMLRLAGDAAGAEAFGKAARARYETLFTQDRMVAAYADLYRQLLAHPV